MTVWGIDVNIDSDNDDGFNPPEGDDWEEYLESSDYGIGKLVYKDASQFTPIRIRLPQHLDPDDSSNKVLLNGSLGGSGIHRLWNVPKSAENRSELGVSQGGNILASILGEYSLRELDLVLSYDELTHWEREEWTIRTFFRSKDAVAACEFISAKKTSELAEWISAGGDVNLTGDHGMTLLFWAMLDRNMIAFDGLMVRGADPTLVLTKTIQLKNGSSMQRGDSVMFAATEFRDYDFMLTAMPYTDRPDQRDLENQNLLQRVTLGFGFTSVPPYVFAELVRAGVEPDVRDDRYGTVPAVKLVSVNRPAECLAMLVAGADPLFESSYGESVVSEVRLCKIKKNPIFATADYQRLVRWLAVREFLDPEFLSDADNGQTADDQTESGNTVTNDLNSD